jgi:hypothetical protein
MSRYLIILGVAIIVFGIAGGSIAIMGAYNAYQSQLHVSGDPVSNPLTVLGEAKWQAARLAGGATIVGSVISGSIVMGLGWIGAALEQIRRELSGKRESQHQSRMY